MKTLTIAQKMSGTGSIHDIASQHCDRDIRFPADCHYAVVFASFYGGRGYTCHRTLETAQKTAAKLSEYSLVILDTDGREWGANYNDGIKMNTKIRDIINIVARDNCGLVDTSDGITLLTHSVPFLMSDCLYEYQARAVQLIDSYGHIGYVYWCFDGDNYRKIIMQHGVSGLDWSFSPNNFVVHETCNLNDPNETRAFGGIRGFIEHLI